MHSRYYTTGPTAMNKVGAAIGVLTNSFPGMAIELGEIARDAFLDKTGLRRSPITWHEVEITTSRKTR